MNTPRVFRRAACLRLAVLLGLAAAALSARLAADPLNCDLSQYKAQSGLTAAVKGDVLTVTWAGSGNDDVRVRYAIDNGQPIIRELAIRRAHGAWSVLGQNLTAQFDVQTGHRRIDFAGLAPLRLLGVDITAPDVVEHQAWVSFWDAPFVIPSDPKRTPGPLRAASEVQRANGTFATTSCTVHTDGARLEVNFPGLSMGIFSGGIRFTHYRTSSLLRVEAIAKTEKNLVAYKYAVALKGLSLATLPRTRWLDTGGNPQEYMFGGAIHDSPVTVRAKNRVMVAEGPKGSIAVFPPPTVFFPAREVDTNLGYVWFRKDSAGQYSIGVKQADHEDNPRFLQNFAVYNAPPGTMQRMAAYFYVSPDDGLTTRAEVMAFTHNDIFQPLPGYKTFVNHFHLRFTDILRASGSLDTQTPDLVAMRAIGVNLVGLSDFHDDALAQSDPGPKRFADQHDYIEGTRRASDTDFLVLPWEEPSTYYGGHTNLMNARPIYFSKVRRPGQPFTEQDPKYGTVYHLGKVADVMQFLDATDGYWYTAHPRTKSSAGYPDAYWDKPFTKTDRYLGVAFKPGMGMDLSEQRLADWRVFDSMDTMNNMNADSGLQPKYAIGDCDTYQKWPHDDLYPGFPVNYLKLDKVPGPDDDWSPILRSLRQGDFFVTTGEIYIRNYAVKGTGSQRTLVADVDWTFPLEFVEVVWGDGKTIDRQVIRATDLPSMGSKHFEIPFDATGKKWVRFAVWDSAVNGAFVQPVWLH
jgi:hypothetical protein